MTVRADFRKMRLHLFRMSPCHPSAAMVSVSMAGAPRVSSLAVAVGASANAGDDAALIGARREEQGGARA